MKNINTVIFDVGNVLIPWEVRKLYRKIFADEVQMEEFLTTTDFAKWNVRQDEGYPFALAIAEQETQYPQYKGKYQAYYDNYLDSIGEPIKPMVELLYKLQKNNYRTLALTNFSLHFFNIVRSLPQFKFLDDFEGIVISGVEGIVKPDIKIYELICSRYKVQPENALFIDDALQNIEGAQKAGLNTVHYINSEQTINELKLLNINCE